MNQTQQKCFHKSPLHFITFCQMYINLLKIQVQEIGKCNKHKELSKVLKKTNKYLKDLLKRMPKN